MSVHDRLVEALLRVYPAAWRQEYGSELADVLAQRPLTAVLVADVLWSGARQRCRSFEPAGRVGVISLFASNHVVRVPDEDRESRGVWLILTVSGMVLSVIGWLRWLA